MKKRIKIIILSIVTVLVLLSGGFFVYASDYSHADQTLAEDKTQVTVQGNLLILDSTVPGDTGLIFYPGGKVEAEAYLPLLDQLRDQGISCVLVKMPFNLAVFNKNGGEAAFDARPEITHWIIGGHSLGGVMASSFAVDHPDQIEEVILLGAYVYGGWSPDKALTIYGSQDLVLDQTKVDYDTNVIVLEGGNHANYGNYGKQKGDGTASISKAEQQKQTVEAIMAFIGKAE
jgi:Alpha/beta hydrolase family